MEAAFLVTSFKFGKDGFIIRLPSLNQMVEDASELVSGVFGGLKGTVARALRTVIIAQVGLIVVKGESRHTKRLRDAVFGSDLGSADAPSGTGPIFWAEVEPGAERVVGWKWRQIRAKFTEDGLNAEHVKAGDSREIDTEDPFEMAVEIKSRGARRGATGRLRGSGWPTVLTLKSFDALLNFLVAVGNELLVVTVSGEGLFEREDMLRTIVTNQAFGNGFNGSFDAVVAQFG